MSWTPRQFLLVDSPGSENYSYLNELTLLYRFIISLFLIPFLSLSLIIIILTYIPTRQKKGGEAFVTPQTLINSEHEPILSHHNCIFQSPGSSCPQLCPTIVCGYRVINWAN